MSLLVTLLFACSDKTSEVPSEAPPVVAKPAAQEAPKAKAPEAVKVAPEAKPEAVKKKLPHLILWQGSLFKIFVHPMDCH